MTASHPKPFGIYNGGGKPQAQFDCSLCAEFTRVSLSGLHGPEQTVQVAQRLGWRVDAFGRRGSVCPRCISACPANDPDSELKRKGLIPVAQNSEPARLSPGPAARPTVDISPRPAPPEANRNAALAQPTTEQRVKIRNLLDRHFDDGDGVYLDGMSDHRIAEAVDVPRIVVENMREAAYGPIRVDAEAVALRADMAKLAADLAVIDRLQAAAKSAHAGIVARLEKHIGGKAAP